MFCHVSNGLSETNNYTNPDLKTPLLGGNLQEMERLKSLEMASPFQHLTISAYGSMDIHPLSSMATPYCILVWAPQGVTMVQRGILW
mmetsp:Transcript_46553/g.90959  ORF Transcript_46553/g.90959 Transcript_46553/m.90959 type:complete len:87 (-) Transcript_46553:78-338(-)